MIRHGVLGVKAYPLYFRYGINHPRPVIWVMGNMLSWREFIIWMAMGSFTFVDQL